MTELRCDNSILFGVVAHDRLGMYLEVKCRSSRCGARGGVVVLHRFRLPSCELIDTRHYKNPPNRKAPQHEYSPGHGSAVRPA